MGEELENVAIRLPMSVVVQVDAHIDTLRKGAPWAKVGRSDALRDLVVRGLHSLAPLQPPPPIPPQPAPHEETTAIVSAPECTTEVPKAALAQRLQQMRSGGMSLQKIADQLQAEGVPTLSGRGHWQKGSVERLLAITV